VHFSSDSASIGGKPGLNRCEHWLCSRRALKWLEPDEAKVSRPVLRGGDGGNAISLPDSTGFRSALSPHDHARSSAQTACSSRSEFFGPQERRASVCGRRAALRSGSVPLDAPLRSPLHFPARPSADRSREIKPGDSRNAHLPLDAREHLQTAFSRRLGLCPPLPGSRRHFGPDSAAHLSFLFGGQGACAAPRH
jgi:hypothetical protein